MYICYIVIISPWIKAWPIISTNLNTLYSAKFGLNWPRSSFLRRFLNFVHVFSLFHNYLLLKKVWPFIWINLNPLHQECFVPSLVDLAQWFSRRWKCEKFTDKWTDGLLAIRKAQVSKKRICQVYNFHVYSITQISKKLAKLYSYRYFKYMNQIFKKQTLVSF